MTDAAGRMCSDAEFLRRSVSLDFKGMPRRWKRSRPFLADPRDSRIKRTARNRRIDISTASDISTIGVKGRICMWPIEKFVTEKWSLGLRKWIRNGIATNKRYDKFVAVIVRPKAARSEPGGQLLPVSRETTRRWMENLTQVFLGTRFS